ncbi:MAG: phage tail tape measure protein [Comamonas sp.]
MAFKPIEILINAKDNASSVFSSLQAKIAAVGAAVAGYFGIKAFVGVVRGAADLEAALSRVQAATGASGEEMRRLSKAAQDAGANTKFTSIEAAGALENLAKAGLSAADSIATLPAVLDLAGAGGIGLGEASEYITKAVMGMGLAFTDAARVADVLALGANATNTSVTGLAQALSYAAPIAQSANLSLEGTVAMMGKLADGGIDASRSGTALANVLAQFSDPASQFKRALADAGITTNNFEEALHQLADAGPKGEKAILAVGLNAGPALRSLLNQGMSALDELKGKLQNAAGSAAEAARIMGDNLQGSFKGLQNAWQAVKDTLGKPVLPVLKEGVDQLANAFRSFVADGTIARFGQSIATAFGEGIKWVREFVGAVDFQAVAAKMQAWADQANAAFQSVGEFATRTGGVLKTAWGVMSAGTNVLLTAIYGIGSAFSEMASIVMQGVAKLREGLATVTFGGLSESFKLAAEDARSMAQGFGEAAQAMRDKSVQSMQDVADGAQLARDGFASFVGGMESTRQKADPMAAALAKAAVQISAIADANEKAASAQEAKTKSDEAARAAAQEHAAAVAQLRGEYAALIAAGDLTAAGQKLQEINKALQGTTASSGAAGKAAADAARAIEDAFTRLGITSSEALKTQAANAKRDYETIKNAGTTTAEDIAAAFEKAATDAIAANKGIAPAWVQAEAAMRGFELEVDKAGKTTLKLKSATDQAADAHKNAAGAAGQQLTALERLNAEQERAIAAQEKANDLATRSLKLDEAKRMAGVINPVDAVPSFESQDQADAWLAEWKKQYAKKNAGIVSGSSTRTFMWDTTMGEWNGEVSAMKLRNTMKGNGNASESSQTPLEAMRSGQRITINLQLDGRSYGDVDTDANGAAALQSLMRELERAKRNTGR